MCTVRTLVLNVSECLNRLNLMRRTGSSVVPAQSFMNTSQQPGCRHQHDLYSCVVMKECLMKVVASGCYESLSDVVLT